MEDEQTDSDHVFDVNYASIYIFREKNKFLHNEGTSEYLVRDFFFPKNTSWK